MFSGLSSVLQDIWREMTTPPDAPSPSASSPSSAGSLAMPTGSYIPSPDDVGRVRSLLAHGIGLPVELVDMVLDAAEYFPAVHAARMQGIQLAASQTRAHKVAHLFLTAGPVPEARADASERRVKARSVRFYTRSRDQGWVSDRSCVGTYNGSFSWFEACILRPTGDPSPNNALPPDGQHLGRVLYLSPEDAVQDLQRVGWELVEHEGRKLWKIQTNVVAGRQYGEHEVEWKVGEESETTGGSGDGKGFVEALRPGDCVGVWVRAMFPGWANNVDQVEVEIRYSV